MSKKIILCGIDGAGKSTLSDKIIKDNSDIDFKIVHCTRHTPNTFEYFKDLFLSNDNIIFDRACYGQFVYQTSEERKERGQLTLKELYDLEEIILKENIKVYYVYSDLDVCLHNCQKDSEDSYYTLSYLSDLDKRFRYLFEHISIVPVEYYYNDYHPVDVNKNNDIDYLNFDYSSLPKVAAVDFDSTLVLGESFPKIGKLNDKLVNELFNGTYKDYKKILFTNRSGDSLIDACNFLADNGIYFDAVNDDIPEVKEILKRNPIDHRKIWFDVLIDDKALNVDKFI